MLTQRFVNESGGTHKFMLVSVDDERFNLPSFHSTYDEAFTAMLTELAEALEVDAEWLLEVADPEGYDDGCTFSFSRTAASYYHRHMEWEIICVAVTYHPETGGVPVLTAVDNWPDADIAPELYCKSGGGSL